MFICITSVKQIPVNYFFAFLRFQKILVNCFSFSSKYLSISIPFTLPNSDLIFIIISITFEQYNENPLVTNLFLRRLLGSIVLWISGMSSFVLQNNVVRFDIPVHICTTVICIGYRICNRIDKFHFGVVVIVL